MKNLLMSLACVTVLFLSSCTTDSTGNVSSITVFPEITLIGDDVFFVESGTSYTDPGVNASSEFVQEGTVNTGQPGFYTVAFIVTNADGFQATARRTVIVYENDGSVAGVYMGRRTTRGIESPILVSTRSDGDFDCTDILGGYYEQSTNNYGAAYGADAVIAVNVGSGTVTSANGGLIGFGPISMSDGTVSPDGRTMNWTATLDDYAFGFPVELLKVTP